MRDPVIDAAFSRMSRISIELDEDHLSDYRRRVLVREWRRLWEIVQWKRGQR